MSKEDVVNHPSHYTKGRFEVIEFIEDKGFSYHRGNAIKYLCRAGLKNKDKLVEDLEKARWYINREIELIRASDVGMIAVSPKDMVSK